ncbi:hypothetical protein J7T55_013550 [Diaporthe amygdali]|uniref:uncharacterized protein n=1 Tax=Phomopsis amygdali TaxID=1214568 RepID=UPI0022FE20F8|nr:uncharacterized protein J7T55_013550 [Diaporthe amygdali]KAJ0119312.1 hypothetical protein J7T55_013550 [Diaporthe amygdali]
MAVNVGDEESERRVVLTQSRPVLKIGRSSNRSSLGLTPMLNNGYFDSPVMSRDHAEIIADIPAHVIRIRDAGSMHGTYLNNEPLESEDGRPLVAGDKVTFGVPVYRNQKTFQPAIVTVGMEFQNAGQADHSPSRVFTVPDDCSTDENEPLDDNAPQKIPTYISEQEINPWREEMDEDHPEVRQVDGVIEIDSESESDAPLHDCISITSSDDDHFTADVADLTMGYQDDDESISLTDDEQGSTAPASLMDSIDLDSPGPPMKKIPRSPSWNSVSTDSYSEHAEEPPQSDHNSEDEQGVFLYDSESEEMDEVDPIDVDFDSCSEPANNQGQFVPSHPIHLSHPGPSGHPVLPSISTAVFSLPYIPETPFGYQLAPVMQQAPRHPSPSDAVLPVSRRHHGSEDDCGVTVESSGRKSEKADVFEAREENKISMARSSALLATEPNSVVEASSKTAIEESTFRPLTENLCPCPASSSTEVGKPSDSAPFKDAFPTASPQPAAYLASVSHISKGPEESQGSRGSEDLRSPYGHALLNSGEAFLNAPLEETFEVNLKSPEAVDLGWTAASAEELFQMKQLAQIRPDKASGSSNPQDAPVITERTKEASGYINKRKRRAVDISEATDQELLWHEQSPATHELAPRTPSIAEPEIETDLSKLSFHATPEQEPTAARPTKMRKIAERMGYAALGGATVGAMVLTSLIYTAPNFA